MIELNNEKVLMVDVDHTLIVWELSDYPDLERLTVDFNGYRTELGIHKKNVNLLKKFAKLGYSVVVWSRSGASWASCISKALKIEDYVTACMSKPLFYLDDQDCKKWMGSRIWRDPITGKEQTD